MAVAVVVIGMLALPVPAGAKPKCPISYGSKDDAKPNKLYAYFPLKSDSTFPEFSNDDVPTSPAAAFDMANLPAYKGTAAELRDAIFDVVTDDYCEFNVQVRQTTTSPPSTFDRRNIAAIGTDVNGGLDDHKFGQADEVDPGDADHVDYARVWAGSFQDGAGGPGGELEGANSTLGRWANSIGGTVSHETGHNYGLTHTEGAQVDPGEDAAPNHLMVKGGDATYEQRASLARHFNNANFATLASNVGLSVQTMHNWDLTNPNAQSGRSFRLTFLSPQESPIVSWSYSGERSPWVSPKVAADGTQTFKGKKYNRFTLKWSKGQKWDSGPIGKVPGGATFHVGATFSGVDLNKPDPVIITKSELLDGAGKALRLQPRLVGYDEGDIDIASGDFSISFDNLGIDGLRLRAVDVQLLPRVLSIDAMLPGKRLRDWSGRRFSAYRGSHRVLLNRPRGLAPGRTLQLPVARMSQERQVVERVTEDCGAGDAQVRPDTRGCRPGTNVSLFPATTLYLRATVVDPDALVWSRRKRRYVQKDVESRIFYQLGGVHPDLNGNGADDYLDILEGRSKDADGDGVPDEAQGARR
ncbi:MAG TPA: hypothetical protein VF715_16945 [Thermoleophilaceae bacterium]